MEKLKMQEKKLRELLELYSDDEEKFELIDDHLTTLLDFISYVEKQY
jgi:hypothetical protein